MDYEWVIKNHPLGRVLISRILKGAKQYTKVERRHVNKWLYSREGVREIGHFLELED